MNIDNELKAICAALGITIEDSRYYVNESTWYEFKTSEDMLTVLTELLKVIQDEPYKITIHNEDAHAIEIFIVED